MSVSTRDTLQNEVIGSFLSKLPAQDDFRTVTYIDSDGLPYEYSVMAFYMSTARWEKHCWKISFLLGPDLLAGAMC